MTVSRVDRRSTPTVCTAISHCTRRGGYQPPAGQRRFTGDLWASQLTEHLSVIGLRRCHLPSRGGQCVKKLPKAGNKPRRVSPPQRRNKIKIAISGDMRIGNRTLHPKRFDSFSKKTENLLGCNPLCQKSNAFLTVSPPLKGRPCALTRPRVDEGIDPYGTSRGCTSGGMRACRPTVRVDRRSTLTCLPRPWRR